MEPSDSSPDCADDDNRKHAHANNYRTPLDMLIADARSSMHQAERWGHPEHAAEWRELITKLETLR